MIQSVVACLYVAPLSCSSDISYVVGLGGGAQYLFRLLDLDKSGYISPMAMTYFYNDISEVR